MPQKHLTCPVCGMGKSDKNKYCNDCFDYVLPDTGEAYEQYLSLPKATIHKKDSEIYNNRWCVITGRSFRFPNPHRHYSYREFIEKLDNDEKFRERFLNNKKGV